MSKDHGRPGALVTDGHGTVQWAGLERKKQNLLQSAEMVTAAPSPRRNVRRMVPQNESEVKYLFKEDTNHPLSPTRPLCATPRDSHAVPVSAYPSVVTHTVSPPRASIKSSPAATTNVSMAMSSPSAINTLDVSGVSRTSSVASQQSQLSARSGAFSERSSSSYIQRPTTAEPRVPPHMRTRFPSVYVCG